MSGSTDYISTISKAYSTGKPGATTFEDILQQMAEHQTGKSYVFDLDENGDVRNCTVTSSGKLTGPTEEEQRQFEAEQAKKRKCLK